MDVTVKKILAPIDRSKYKEKIIEHAISLGKARGAEIVAIHVIDPGHGIPGARIKEKELEREERATKPAHELLNGVDLLAEGKGVHIKKEVVKVSDTVGKAIIDYAKTNKFDVIIIGTSGMGRVQRMFLGSVANHVIHHAHCSVFAVR